MRPAHTDAAQKVCGCRNVFRKGYGNSWARARIEHIEQVEGLEQNEIEQNVAAGRLTGQRRAGYQGKRRTP